MTASKSVLIVSYTFPPTGGAGVQRVSKFVKYLREFDWEPMVLTALNPSVPLQDATLLDDIPADVRVFKAKTLEPSYTVKRGLETGGRTSLKSKVLASVKNALRQLFLPDPQILWWPQLLMSLKEIIKQEAIDCIFVTSPPYSVLVPTVFVANFFNVPIVIDFRDEWSFSREQWENATKNAFSRKVDGMLEGYVLRNCTRFTAATAAYVNSILARYPGLDENKGVVVTNGYDEDDLQGSGGQIKDDRFTFVYTGTVWNATTLRPFMEAMNMLILHRPELKERVKVKVIGRVVDSELDAFRGAAMPVVSLLGYLEHRDAISHMKGADVLLLSLNDLPGAERIFPGKLFEYMATGNHILAMVPDGETKELLYNHHANNTSFASATSAEDIAEKVAHLIDSGPLITAAGHTDVRRFSRRHLAGQLAKILADVVAARHEKAKIAYLPSP